VPSLDLLRHRLYNQQLTQPQFATPVEVVAWLGAVQAQEFPGALWSIGQRMLGASAEQLNEAFDTGAILRTHVMRPTWHFVAPADLRWLLALTAPRVHALNASYYRRFELDAGVLKRCHAVLARALRGGQYRTRVELQKALQQAGIDRNGIGLGLIMMHAELEGLICSGPRRGKQFTYALLEERVPPTPALSREAALAELARRYFTSHGPAQVHDFAWWSGLTVADTRAALAMLGDQFEHIKLDGKAYWFKPAAPPAIPRRAHLLPTYDEYGIAYKDRRGYYDPADVGKPEAGYREGFPNLLVIGGRVTGLWRRTLTSTSIIVEPRFWRQPAGADQLQFTAAVRRYAEFLALAPMTV
jgi:hypothetical protein